MPDRTRCARYPIQRGWQALLKGDDLTVIFDEDFPLVPGS